MTKGERAEQQFRDIYEDLYKHGIEVEPRGLKVKESQNYSFYLTGGVRFANFESRKLSLDYIKREFLWYLKGDKYDTSIADHAKIWKSTIDDRGIINSNYGQYIFGEINQFWRVVDILKEDRDSRRASIMILSSDHVLNATHDVPCTYAINFRIRMNSLNMSVHMRSQDAIYGLGNDIPTFSFIHEMMQKALKKYYPDLALGHYYHVADSFHVYERHFEMLRKIAKGDKFNHIEVPEIDGPEEVDFLTKLHEMTEDSELLIPEDYKFTKWLTEIYAS